MIEMDDASMEDVDSADVRLVARKRRLLKKAPDAPKRFKSAYICFVMEKMDDVKKNLPRDIKVLRNPICHSSTFMSIFFLKIVFFLAPCL